MNALYVICGLGVLSLLAEIANLKKRLVAILTVGIAVAAGAALMDWDTSIGYFSDMLVFDNFAIAFTVLICLVSVLWFWMAHSYFHDETHITDQAALVLFVIAGAIILASFNNMAMLFLGIEILSLSLYVLAGSKKESMFSNEAAFKYFLMGSFATGFLLMGIALIYGATGLFHLDRIADYSIAHSATLPGFYYAGILLIMVGMAFKVSAVPFHFWAPDVYEGAPTSITAFMSTVVKVAAFSAFVRLFSVCFSNDQQAWSFVLQIIIVLTLVIANVTAVSQDNVKRMLAYSSVGHAGYVLLALVSSPNSAGVIFYYLSAYAVSSILAFTILGMQENAYGDLAVKSFNGFFKSNPFLAVGLIVSMLSLAGIPPLAGFFGKYLVFSIALENEFTWLVVLAILTSLIGVYYYFKVVIAMFADAPDAKAIQIGSSNRILILVLILAVILLGVFPDLIRLL